MPIMDNILPFKVRNNEDTRVVAWDNEYEPA